MNEANAALPSASPGAASRKRPSELPSGALVATFGIFLPAFFFVAWTAPLLSKLRSSSTAGHIFDGINAASLALMVVVTWQLTRSGIVDLPTLVTTILSAVLLLRFRINSAWLIVAAGAFGWLYRR